MQYLISIAVLLLAAASLFGWGNLVRRVARQPAPAWPVTICLGLGAVLFIGGVVNLARMAFAVTLWAIAAIGLLSFIVSLSQARASFASIPAAVWTSRSLSERIEIVVTAMFIAAVLGFAMATQLPPDAFNFHDDLQKYFAHPVRQLATGTLYGSPLSALGSETLGGMAFLHSFVLSIFPLPYINGVDAIFGLALVMIVGAFAGWRRIAPLPGALFAPLLIASIEPQYVNVSALYLAGALIAAAILLVARSEDGESEKPSALALGLIYAGLIALKPTFGIFPALHLLFLLIGFSMADRALRQNVGWALRTGLWTTAFIAPWIALHVPHYLNWSDIPTDLPPASIPEQGIDLLATSRLFYGYVGLLGLAAFAIVSDVISYAKAVARADKDRCAGLIGAALTSIIIFPLFLFVLGAMLNGTLTSIRYAIPLLIGIVPVALMLSIPKSQTRFGFARTGIPIVALLAVVVVFGHATRERYMQATQYGSILFFSGVPREPAYLQYNRLALSADRAQAIRKLQALVPSSQPLLAVINQPFDLDFSRNSIVDVDPAGLATPWARRPPLQYVIWEYKGYGVRTPQEFQTGMHEVGLHNRLIASRTLNFGLQLSESIRKGTILYSDDSFVVARLPPS